MASKQEVLDAIAGLGTDIDADFGNLGQQITDLQTRIANGGQLEANDLSDILSAVNAVRSSTAAKFTAIGNLGQQITDLQTRIANGGQFEANDLGDILTAVNAVRSSTAAKFTAIGSAESPAPAPSPEPPAPEAA